MAALTIEVSPTDELKQLLDKFAQCVDKLEQVAKGSSYWQQCFVFADEQEPPTEQQQEHKRGALRARLSQAEVMAMLNMHEYGMKSPEIAERITER